MEASVLIKEVQETEEKASKLKSDFNKANNTLESRVNNSKTTRNNAQRLLERASQLSTSTSSKLKELKGKSQ